MMEYKDLTLNELRNFGDYHAIRITRREVGLFIDGVSAKIDADDGIDADDIDYWKYLANKIDGIINAFELHGRFGMFDKVVYALNKSDAFQALYYARAVYQNLSDYCSDFLFLKVWNL